MKKNLIPILISLLIITLALFPALFYFYNFHESLSKNQSDWASFGSYLSGTSGTILSTASIFALIYTLYATLKNNEKTHELTIISIENTNKQIKYMEREFSIKLINSHIETLNEKLKTKKYAIGNKPSISFDEFNAEAYRLLRNTLWARLANTIPENKRGYDFFVPGFILSDMKVSFDEESTPLMYIIDIIHNTTDEETKNVLLRMYHSQINKDLLYWMVSYNYTYRENIRKILDNSNMKLLFITEKAALAITEANRMVAEGTTPWA